jgi:hypothetical protein
MIDEEKIRRIVREELTALLDKLLIRRRPPEGLSEKRRRAAEIRWGKDASAMQVHKRKPRKKIEKHASAMQPQDEEKSPGAQAFIRYAAAFKLRYETWPVRNAKVNSLLAQLAKRLGAEAPDVAEFYLTLEEPLYVRSVHAVDLLVRDAEKIRTAWATGKPGGNGQAPPKAWWEHWAGIEAQGDELGVDRDPEHPQQYRAMVMRAARGAGKLPDHVAHKLGLE